MNDSSNPKTPKIPNIPKISKVTERKQTAADVVMGYRLLRARLTSRGWVFIALVFAVPVLGTGLLLDALLQWALGRCLGVWCWF